MILCNNSSGGGAKIARSRRCSCLDHKFVVTTKPFSLSARSHALGLLPRGLELQRISRSIFLCLKLDITPKRCARSRLDRTRQLRLQEDDNVEDKNRSREIKNHIKSE